MISSPLRWLSLCLLAATLAPSAWPQALRSQHLPPQPDPIAGLIDQAEKEFQAGQTNYQTGHLVAARLNFDNAFNLLLESPYDIHSDERLQREFDRIVNGASSLELAALEQGDGFTQQKSEPAPIDQAIDQATNQATGAANELTFPVDPNVKAQAEAEIRSTHSDLPLMLTDPVVSFLNYFSHNGKGVLERGLIRSGRYET